MARKSKAEKLSMLMALPGVASLPDDRKYRLSRVFAYLTEHGLSGFRIGSVILTQNEILAETRIENHNEEPVFNLEIARGILAFAPDGALFCPALEVSSAAARASRENGKKGGRPRKLEPKLDPEVPLKRASQESQRNFLLPVNGGKSKTCDARQVSPPTYLLSKVKSEVSVEDAEFHETGRLVLDAVGIDPVRSMMRYDLVRQWLADGADRALILEVVAKKTKPGITTLKYFSAAISEAIAARGPKKPQYEREWKIAYDVWHVGGQFGPMPQLADYKAKYVA